MRSMMGFGLVVMAAFAAPTQAAEPPAAYKTGCAACHDNGIAGAPKPGDKAAWEPRIAQGVPTLYEHAIKGFKTMPPKGMCPACSDDDIKKIVDFLVKQAS